MLSAKVLIEITQQLTRKGNSVQLILITATEITPQNKIPVHGGKTNNSLLRDVISAQIISEECMSCQHISPLGLNF